MADTISGTTDPVHPPQRLHDGPSQHSHGCAFPQTSPLAPTTLITPPTPLRARSRTPLRRASLRCQHLPHPGLGRQACDEHGEDRAGRVSLLFAPAGGI